MGNFSENKTSYEAARDKRDKKEGALMCKFNLL